MLDREQYWLDRYFESGAVYNKSKSAFGGTLECLEPTRQKISLAQKGKKRHTEESKQRHSEFMIEYCKIHGGPMDGKHHTEKTRDGMSVSANKRWESEEARQKQKETLIDYYQEHIHPIKGRRHTNEENQRNREAHIGNENAATPYPAFYNIITNEFIPAGRNLAKICRERGLKWGPMRDIRSGINQRTRDGWKLALES